jgi:hypothetical protein
VKACKKELARNRKRKTRDHANREELLFSLAQKVPPTSELGAKICGGRFGKNRFFFHF